MRMSAALKTGHWSAQHESSAPVEVAAVAKTKLGAGSARRSVTAVVLT